MEKRVAIGLAGAILALFVAYYASGLPISAYSIYREELDMTSSQLSLTSALYLLGTVIPLLFLTRISNYLGRRPVAIGTLILAIVGSLVFTHLTSPGTLILGRFIQGFVSGLGSSALATYVVDLCIRAKTPVWFGPTVTSITPTVGISLGALTSGAVIEFTGLSVSVLFEIVAAFMVAVIILVILGQETRAREKGVLSSIRPKIQVPDSAKHLLVTSSLIFVGTWAIGGVYQAYSSTFATMLLGNNDSFMAALILVSMIFPVVIGGFFANRFELITAQRIGIGLFAVSFAFVVLSLHEGWTAIFFICNIICGFCQGVGYTCSMMHIINRASFDERSGTFSAVYLVSYGGAAVPNLIVGIFAGTTPVLDVMYCYLVFLVVMAVILFVLTAKGYEEVLGKARIHECQMVTFKGLFNRKYRQNQKRVRVPRFASQYNTSISL